MPKLSGSRAAETLLQLGSRHRHPEGVGEVVHLILVGELSGVEQGREDAVADGQLYKQKQK